LETRRGGRRQRQISKLNFPQEYGGPEENKCKYVYVISRSVIT
jgi:hypothetical protein